MKKMIYLFIGIILLGCSKSIDIEYNQSKKEVEDSLVGIWDGALSCPDCDDKKYRYTLTIENHKNKTATGSLKITKIPEQQDYILFDVSVSITNNILEVLTTDIIEEFNEASGVYWCKENKYVLELSSNKKILNGEWISSGNCTVFSNSNTIEINKQ